MKISQAAIITHKQKPSCKQKKRKIRKRVEDMEHEKVINHHTNKRNAYKFQRLEQKEKNVNKLIETEQKQILGSFTYHVQY